MAKKKKNRQLTDLEKIPSMPKKIAAAIERIHLGRGSASTLDNDTETVRLYIEQAKRAIRAAKNDLPKTGDEYYPKTAFHSKENNEP